MWGTCGQTSSFAGKVSKQVAAIVAADRSGSRTYGRIGVVHPRSYYRAPVT